MQKFPSDKLYVGQTINISSRFNNYKRFIGSNPHHTSALKLYGLDSVIVEIVSCPKYLLDTIETFLINFLDLTNPKKGYNKTSGGRKGCRFSLETRKQMSETRKGKLLGDIHKQKISESLKGYKNPMFDKPKSAETRQKLSKSLTGRIISEETKQKISNTTTGKVLSEETKQKISESQTGESNSMYGKNHSDETKQKMSESQRDKIVTEETKKKISESNKGKTRTEEAKKRMSDSHKGKSTGEQNSQSKPTCAFGKLYASASIASNILRNICDTKSQGNFLISWAKSKKHENDVFYVTKEFYNKYRNYDKLITRTMYDEFIKNSLVLRLRGG